MFLSVFKYIYQIKLNIIIAIYFACFSLLTFESDNKMFLKEKNKREQNFDD